MARDTLRQKRIFYKWVKNRNMGALWANDAIKIQSNSGLPGLENYSISYHMMISYFGIDTFVWGEICCKKEINTFNISDLIEMNIKIYTPSTLVGFVKQRVCISTGEDYGNIRLTVSLGTSCYQFSQMN